ncbi:MAG TPA: methyltransferase domain-containing protein [Solirubrobacterales bacterium]|nr:methyltransferase domain-containing protein [Solirubrobacterales bacterium]
MSSTPSSRALNAGPRDWDAETYDRVSDPQFGWGMEVLERLELAGDETVLDAGCGSGRVTAELLKRLPRGRVIAVDASPSMLAKARENLGDRVRYSEQDLAELEIDEPVDVVFSTATFHWIADHEGLFARVHDALVPGGRLHAQCGGAGNVREHAEAIARVTRRAEFAPHFEGMPTIWNFATAGDTERRLDDAGFVDVRTWLEPKPLQPERPREFIRTVTLGPHLAFLPDDHPELREAFVEAVAAEMDEPLTLGYVRLNIEAGRPA